MPSSLIFASAVFTNTVVCKDTCDETFTEPVAMLQTRSRDALSGSLVETHTRSENLDAHLSWLQRIVDNNLGKQELTGLVSTLEQIEEIVNGFFGDLEKEVQDEEKDETDALDAITDCNIASDEAKAVNDARTRATTDLRLHKECREAQEVLRTQTKEDQSGTKCYIYREAVKKWLLDNHATNWDSLAYSLKDKAENSAKASLTGSTVSDCEGAISNHENKITACNTLQSTAEESVCLAHIKAKNECGELEFCRLQKIEAYVALSAASAGHRTRRITEATKVKTILCWCKELKAQTTYQNVGAACDAEVAALRYGSPGSTKVDLQTYFTVSYDTSFTGASPSCVWPEVTASGVTPAWVTKYGVTPGKTAWFDATYKNTSSPYKLPIGAWSNDWGARILMPRFQCIRPTHQWCPQVCPILEEVSTRNSKQWDIISVVQNDCDITSATHLDGSGWCGGNVGTGTFRSKVANLAYQCSSGTPTRHTGYLSPDHTHMKWENGKRWNCIDGLSLPVTSCTGSFSDGTKLSDHTGQDLKGCRKKCEDNSNCDRIVFKPDGSCTLRQGGGKSCDGSTNGNPTSFVFTRRAGAGSGSVTLSKTWSTVCKGWFKSTTSKANEPLTSVAIPSGVEDECKLLCERDSSCAHITFSASRICTLYKQVGNSVCSSKAGRPANSYTIQ